MATLMVPAQPATARPKSSLACQLRRVSDYISRQQHKLRTGQQLSILAVGGSLQEQQDRVKTVPCEPLIIVAACMFEDALLHQDIVRVTLRLQVGGPYHGEWPSVGGRYP
jgi:hypothetical protein